MSQSERYTREQYMRREVDHQTYYLDVAKHSGITQNLLPERVKNGVLRSEDPHFNDTPLQVWDRLGSIHPAIEVDEQGRRTTSLGASVCALKAVAKQYVEEHSHEP